MIEYIIAGGGFTVVAIAAFYFFTKKQDPLTELRIAQTANRMAEDGAASSAAIEVITRRISDTDGTVAQSAAERSRNMTLAAVTQSRHISGTDQAASRHQSTIEINKTEEDSQVATQPRRSAGNTATGTG